MDSAGEIDDLFDLDLDDSIFQGGPWDELNNLLTSSSDNQAPELTNNVGLPPSPPHPSNDDNEAQLIYQSARTSIYRSQNTGIKVIDSSALSTQETVQKLLHEETVSKQLLANNCNNHRQVIKVGSFNGAPALHFKWDSGITCKEWLDKVQQIHMQGAEFNIRLRAAMAICTTLREFHQCSVAYNNLSPENIILTPLEGDYIAKFIDLSDAVICSDEETLGDLVAVDLKMLGSIFDQLFQTNNGDEEENVAEYESQSCRRVSVNSKVESEVSDQIRNVRKRGKGHTPGEGLPLYLGAMISTLLADDDNDDSRLRYASAKDVYEDLKAMIAQTVSDGRSSSLNVFHQGIDTINRLKFPNDLFYGMQVQKSMISHLLQSTIRLGDQPLMALIAGYPGTGKSTLVSQIKRPLAEKNGCFIEGKFDVSARPDKVLASALDSFFANINASNTGDNLYMPMRWRILDAIGSSVRCLFDVIPSLRKFMNDSTAFDWREERHIDSVGGGDLGGQRLKHMFCKLISAISCRSQPLVLALDDLQWADDMTLDVIRMLMVDPEIRHFLFLGCYRENEVSEAHILSTNLKQIREQGINFMTIKVGAVDKECVNALISDVMCLPPTLCRPLSTVVHQKTGGIIMFVLRLLTSLSDEGLIWYSMSSHRWMFNLQMIELKEMSEDVVKHMTEQMSRLPRKMQIGLKLCACLGPNFDAAIVERARNFSSIDDNFLETCVDYGFLNTKVGSCHYTWTHDQVQQAAYELIPLQQREKFHLLIGSRLHLNTSTSEMEKFIFYIVDNMNRGMKFVDNPQQKYEMAELNLNAGEKVLARKNFASSVKYFLTGIALLGNDSWETKYSLTIRLYDAASEALCATGDFSKLAAVAEKPLVYARYFQDKLNIYNNVVRGLSSAGENKECIAMCGTVLSELGELLPTTITPSIYREEVAKVKLSLMGQPRQNLLSMPVMTNTNKLTAMRFLNHMLIVTYTSDPALNIVVVFRMVRMTLDFGLCDMSAIAFACYGAWLAASPNDDYEGAFDMGRIALDLMKKLGCGAEILPRIYIVIYGFINIYKEPWQAICCKHSEAFDAAMMSGDTEYALSNNTIYYILAFFNCGYNLKETSQSLGKMIKRALQCESNVAAKMLVNFEQMAFDLMGVNKNAYEAHYGCLDEEELKNFFVQNKLVNLARNLYQKIKYVTYLSGDMDAAAKHYDLQEELNSDFPVQATTGRTSFFFISTFIDGLIGLYFARNGKDVAKWTSVAEKAIELMKKWTNCSSWNFSNKLYLLQAEYFFLRDDERAYACYRESINKAREHKFNHEEGLAHEKLATYLLHKSQHEEALQYFENAKSCYQNWGANVLVERVQKAITILTPLCVGGV